ncbi:MAG: ATP-binding protein [Firmicutes bacterium]|nr:ATP-binding protein [Bacillota bacterium]
MGKDRIRKEVEAEVARRVADNEQARRIAYLAALSDAEFAKLDKEIREQVLKGKSVRKLQDEYDRLFARYYSPVPLLDIEVELEKRLMAESGLVVVDGFKVPEGLEKPYQSLEKYVAKFPNPVKRNLVIGGNTGTGKTVAVNWLGGQLVGRGFSVVYVTAFGMVERIKRYVFERDQEAFGDMVEAELLIIDDLGTEPVIRNVTEENFYNLVNERLVARRATIITTNLDRDMVIERYGDRIASRVFYKEITAELKLTGKDLRA